MFTYRTRRLLSRFFTTVLILLLAAAVTWVTWIIWVDRYIVYSRDGAILDFTREPGVTQGVIAEPPESAPGVDIFFNDGTSDPQS